MQMAHCVVSDTVWCRFCSFLFDSFCFKHSTTDLLQHTHFPQPAMWDCFCPILYGETKRDEGAVCLDPVEHSLISVCIGTL